MRMSDFVVRDSISAGMTAGTKEAAIRELVENLRKAGFFANGEPEELIKAIHKRELLGSTRFKDFLATLHEHFEWVIIDSPPVMAVADSPIIAHIAHGVVFVVGAEMTSRNVAQTAVEQLANANGRVIGAVLNRVDLEHNAYYYSQYYRREYGEYYTATTANTA